MIDRMFETVFEDNTYIDIGSMPPWFPLIVRFLPRLLFPTPAHQVNGR